MAKKAHGNTASGLPITDELIDKLAAKAEAGYDVEETIRRRGGRPPLDRRLPTSSPCALSPSCARHWRSVPSTTTRPPRP
jgi:hypothetical protein